MLCDISQIVISTKHVPIRIAYELLLCIQIHYLYYIILLQKQLLLLYHYDMHTTGIHTCYLYTIQCDATMVVICTYNALQLERSA